MRVIVEAPSLKDGSCQELLTPRRLSVAPASAQGDGLQTRSIRHITDRNELDQATAFKWQRHIQGISKVRHHNELMKYLDLQAQALESTTRQGIKRSAQSMPYKENAQLKPAYFASTVNSCTVCGGTKQPLYACGKCRLLSYDQRITAVGKNQLCFNCLKSGHLKQQCPLLRRCRKCQRPHPTLLHLDDNRDAHTSAGR